MPQSVRILGCGACTGVLSTWNPRVLPLLLMIIMLPYLCHWSPAYIQNHNIGLQILLALTSPSEVATLSSHLHKQEMKLSEAQKTVLGHPVVNGEGWQPFGLRPCSFRPASHFSEPGPLSAKEAVAMGRKCNNVCLAIAVRKPCWWKLN